MNETSSGVVRRPSPLFWLLLLVAGQGASLALIHAGRTVTYQHYDLPGLATPGPHWIALGILVAQAAVVGWLGRTSWSAAADWLRSAWHPVLLLLAVGLLALLAAAPSREVRAYLLELLLAFAVQVVAVANAVLLARSFDASADGAVERRLNRLLAPSDAPRSAGRFLDPFALRVALAVTVLCAVLAVVVFERVPHLPDEIVYLIHARYFAAGMLQLPAPPVPAAFDVDLIYYDAARSFSPVPPGWPAILAVGVKLGVPWLVNPVLSGVAILLFHALMRRVDSPRTARLATLLLATSPWFLFLGMSLMTHSATLAFVLAAALGIAVARHRGVAWPAALAGVATAVVGLIRPMEGLAVAVVLGLWSLGARSQYFRLLPSVALTAVTLLVSSVMRWYNVLLTGSGSRFPIMMYVDKYYAPGANDLGFGANRGMGWGGLDPWPGHGLRDVVLNTMLNGFALNSEMFAWSTGSLLLIVALIGVGRMRRLDWAMVWMILLVVGLHALYWFSGGPDFGARYWFLVIVPCTALAARAASAVFGNGTPAATRSTATVLALSLASMVTFVPWRSAEKYYRYRHMGSEMRDFVQSHSLGKSLVLVRGRRHPDYHEAALENPFDLRAGVTVYAWDRSSSVRRAVVAAYPDRPVYIIDGPTLTNGGFRIVSGPLPPGSVAPGIPSTEDLPGIAGKRAPRGNEPGTP